MSFLALVFSVMFGSVCWLILDYMFGDRTIIQLLKDWKAVKKWFAVMVVKKPDHLHI